MWEYLIPNKLSVVAVQLMMIQKNFEEDFLNFCLSACKKKMSFVDLMMHIIILVILHRNEKYDLYFL